MFLKRTFSNTGTSLIVERLRKLFPIETSLERLKLSLLHETILGMNDLDLSALLSSSVRYSIDERDSDGNTALWWAAHKGDSGAVRLLLESGADPALENNDAKVPLSAAIKNNHLACAHLLLKNCDAGRKEAGGLTLLHLCAWYGTGLDVVKTIIHLGADVNSEADFGATPLLSAVCSKKTEVGKCLLLHNADPNKVVITGESPLHTAITSNHHEMIRPLLEHQADYRLRTKDGETILHHAAQGGDLECLEILYGSNLAGIDVNDRVTEISPTQMIPGIKGLTALQIAEKRQNTSLEWLVMFRKLIDKVAQDTAAAGIVNTEEVYEDAVEHQD